MTISKQDSMDLLENINKAYSRLNPYCPHFLEAVEQIIVDQSYESNGSNYKTPASVSLGQLYDDVKKLRNDFDDFTKGCYK